jgi:8-oxo-dGTP pyrophosphatase MutT (NUDIX family)|tara:strand:+ start:6044 stop:6430 length:387 start_codon:yes stop_codon:yes gene_type:complete
MVFVVAWTYSAEEDGCWIMVKNRSRGWELPGGRLNKGEAPEEAALRELFEETGVLGTAKAIEGDLLPGGYVVLVEIEIPVSPEPWESLDDAIEEVGWCLQLPENSAWGDEEIERIINHDWSTSISLES